jgi:hypothetical protein
MAISQQDTFHLKPERFWQQLFWILSLCCVGSFHGTPRQLERVLAPFPLYLSGRSVSGHILVRKNQLQPDQQKDGHRSGPS